MGISDADKLNYVLIDFENVKPKNLAMLSDACFQIRLFLGAQQSSLDVNIVQAMHNFGPKRAKYIRVTETGKNALDFHLTYYLGELVAKNPKGYFHIISKDKGFDPLVGHLVSRGVSVRRHNDLTDITIYGISKMSDMAELIDTVMKNLKAHGTAKPKKAAALKNMLKSNLQHDLNEKELAKLFQKLVEMKRVTIKDDHVTYHLAG
jgi:hypothetical protein